MASLSYYSHYSCEIPFASVSVLLQRCSSAESFKKARQLHALITTATPPSSSSPFLHNLLLSLYSNAGSLWDARKMFDRMTSRNTVSYNAMISAYSRAPLHHAPSALRLFNDMAAEGLTPNASTYASLVHASRNVQDRVTGTAVHARVVNSGFLNNVCVQTSLLGLYSECGYSEAANLLFSEMVHQDVIAWNSIILNNVKNGSVQHGLLLFTDMLRTGLVPSQCTLSIVLNACGRGGYWNAGRIIHAKMIKSESPPDIPAQNALLDMYASCGDLVTAQSVFERIEERSLVSWNSLIAGYADKRDGERAIAVFKQLRGVCVFGGPYLDEYTYAAVVAATDHLPALYCGKPLHSQVCKMGLENSIYVGNTLICMYFNNNEPDSARKLFSSIPVKDFIVWTEMIAGHSRLGQGELAMRYFYQMQEEGHKVDSFALSSALNSSANLAALHQGETIHSMVVKTGYEADACVSGSLVDMYAKNGKMDSAHAVFHRIREPDLKCWNSIIGGYGYHGNAEQAFKLFNKMVGGGLGPDYVTYVTLLSACSHCGLVERGRFYWFCMVSDGIKPGPKHYTCMVSLLSRAGLLQEAEEMIMRSPFGDCSPELWTILLSSCVNFRKLDMGIYAAQKVLTFELDDCPTHIMLSNLFASVGRWNDVARMRQKIRGLTLEKEPGLSWIEIRGKVHAFTADDESHHQIDDCRNELMRVKGNLEGWEPSEHNYIVSLPGKRARKLKH